MFCNIELRSRLYDFPNTLFGKGVDCMTWIYPSLFCPILIYDRVIVDCSDKITKVNDVYYEINSKLYVSLLSISCGRVYSRWRVID